MRSRPPGRALSPRGSRPGRGPAVKRAVRPLLLITLLLIGCGSPTGNAAPSASPSTAPPSTASPTSPTQSPSPTAAPGYISARLGYHLDLEPPWHRSECLSIRREDRPLVDVFVAGAPRDERASDTGVHESNVLVSAEGNPGRLDLLSWVQGSSRGHSIDEQIEPVTFAGRPAAKVTAASSYALGYYVADGDRIVGVGYRIVEPKDAATIATMRRIVESFRFLSADELRAARDAPSAASVARTAEAVADGLADGFRRRDVAALRALMNDCMSTFIENGGGSGIHADRMADQLRQAFASGVTVTVSARPIIARGDQHAIAATWSEPGKPVQAYDLLLTAEGDRWSWSVLLQKQPVR